MAVSSGQLLIGTTAVAIDGVSTNPYRLFLHNHSTTKSVCIGGADVTIANGFPLDKEQYLEIVVSPNQQIYAVADSADNEFAWLRMDV
jgi:hypothetical protein